MMRTTGARRAGLAALLALMPVAAAAQGIVADHNAVAACAGIPQQYVDSVKTWWVTVPGESHSSGFRIGLALLQSLDPRFAVAIRESGTPDSLPAGALRFSRATWGDVGSATGWRYGYGEEDWYTSQTARSRTAAGIRYCDTHGRPLRATGFGWCWDMTWTNPPGGTEDPVHQVRWAGSSAGGPQGNLIWGLDAGDSALTGNGVCMDTYLAATQSYIDSCAANGWPTTVFFTTGPVDGNDNSENGCQREIKHQYLRQYVALDTSRVLFDYADILCWSDSGDQHIATWNDGGTPRTYPQIHADNMLDTNGSYVEDGDHIGQRGAIRLAKAMWWMLSRLAGWDGTPSGVTAGGSLVRDPALRLSVQPNPFRQRAVISYTLERAGEVELAVYNAVGQRVRTLVRSSQGPGTYAATFEAGAFPAGVYYCRLRAGNDVNTVRFVLMR
ncbi:MAG: T9SS type A sorting domain-containing protein [Candidatus Edwardsbacteria bacterium]|nr:T9SS type A sorting domain-containing protein [Candidatus Edwardsbacteria bacterium]